jgi:hypothetical protein
MKQPSPPAPTVRTQEPAAPADRAIRVLALLGASSAIVAFGLAVFQAPSIPENDHRLAPTFALAHGYRLYYGPHQGPVLSTIYGPVTALTYAPSLLASTPMGTVRLATILPIFLVAGKGEAGSRWPGKVRHLRAVAPSILFTQRALIALWIDSTPVAITYCARS